MNPTSVTDAVTAPESKSSASAQYLIRHHASSLGSELARSILTSTLSDVWRNACLSTMAIVEPAGRVNSWKYQESLRQADRLSSIREWYGKVQSAEMAMKTAVSCKNAVALLNSAISSPAPVPIASANEEGGASLFIDDSIIYGDIEINGEEVEYYLKSKVDNKEYYSIEKMNTDLPPPGLWGLLFGAYARNAPE